MISRNVLAAFTAVAMLAVAPSIAFAQATGKENNATTGSEPGSGPKSGVENKGKPNEQSSGTSSTSTDVKSGAPTSAGSSEEQAKGLRGHSEQPTTGK